MSSQVDSSTSVRAELNRPAMIESFRNRPESETGWDRVKEMWTLRNKYPAPEMEVVATAAKCGFGLGMAYGVLHLWQPSADTFNRRNKEMKFQNPKDYWRKNLDFRMGTSLNFGLRLGLRVGLFSGLYVAVLMTSSMYANEITVVGYAASGAATGAFYQAKVGPRGAIVGCILGGVLGAFGGLVTKALMATSKTDLATIRFELHKTRYDLWEQDRELRVRRMTDDMIEEAKEELKQTETNSG